MPKYTPLKEYLQNSNKTAEVLTFQELEKILGFPLPPSASEHRAWWANGKAKPLSQQMAWSDAGWLVESVSFMGKQVTFRREKPREKPQEKLYKTRSEVFAYFGCPFPLCEKKQLTNARNEMIKQYHPDKVAGMGKEIIELANKKTKEINEMYARAVSYLYKR
jgi:hypothetical protein